MKFKTCYFLGALCILLLTCSVANAQVPNDNCATAIVISDPSSFCSTPFETTNVGATASNVPPPPCALIANHDVWFTFTAVASDVTIVINGQTFTPGGTMQAPFVALYSGDCNNLSALACVSDNAFNNVVELTAGSLTPGNTYYFRVDAQGGGSFQYCIQNYFFNGGVSGDCPEAVVLCDKSEFNVKAVIGPGSIPTEMNDATCFQGLGGESNSTWYVWTAADNGTLEFTLTPNNPADDLDFVVYRLPNGIGDCSGKIVERCMAAGDFDPASPCMGPTGLNATSLDTQQPPGCFGIGDDNFLQYLQLIQGQTYALVVNNFTSSGNGFEVSWGGTAQFVGPSVGFTSNQPDTTLCLGEKLLLTDTSSFANGNITNWDWTFGSNAIPTDTADTKGPHTVQYQENGTKTVTLTVKTDIGCIRSVTHQFNVETCCVLQASVTIGPDCLPDTTCATATAVVSNAIYPVQYNWSTGSTDSLVNNLENGDYILTVTDATGCTDTVHFTVSVVHPYFKMPNAFTPNSDDINDQFFPVVKLVDVLEFQVWSRWGELIHNDYTLPWDGRINGENAASDVYAYRVLVRWPDGHEEVKVGDVTLLR